MSIARGEMKFTEVMPMAVTGIERDVFELRKALAQQAELIKILAAASVGTAALLMNKEGSTLADNQRRVDKAIDLAITAAPQIIGRCLQLNRRWVEMTILRATLSAAGAAHRGRRRRRSGRP
jgi:hypothetical protein